MTPLPTTSCDHDRQLHPRAPKPYGLEYVYISVVRTPRWPTTPRVSLHVLQLTDDGIYAPVSIVAEATVTGKEIAATADAGSTATSCSTSRITPYRGLSRDGVL